MAHVVDTITSDYAPQSFDHVRSLPSLEGKTLADPEFGHSGRVDLLLSIMMLIGALMINPYPHQIVLSDLGRLSSVGSLVVRPLPILCLPVLE